MKHEFTRECWQDGACFVGGLKEVSGVFSFSPGEILDQPERNIGETYQLVAGDADVSPGEARHKLLLLDVARIDGSSHVSGSPRDAYWSGTAVGTISTPIGATAGGHRYRATRKSRIRSVS